MEPFFAELFQQKCVCGFICAPWCPCAKPHCKLNTISPSPLTLPLSLTSQHAAQGQTCISLHTPHSHFPPSFFFIIQTFCCERGRPKYKRWPDVNARICIGAHMVAVMVTAIRLLLFSGFCGLVLIKSSYEVNKWGHCANVLFQNLNTYKKDRTSSPTHSN